MADQSPAIHEKASKTALSTEKECMLLLFTSVANMLKCKTFQSKDTSIISKAAKHISCLIDARSGIAAVTHEPAIEPTVRLYLLESFNLNKMSSH